MTAKTLKEYGLEFINEMAKDRHVAQQEIGVVISGAKSALLTRGSKHFTYKDLDEYSKQVRKDTSRIVDSELTRLTLKSLGRIRRIVQGDARFVEEVSATDFEEQVDTLNTELQN
ncbi:MAG: hypothetical protein JSV04_08520, partial [Candidatus Heimdallarchaeota archaeon]